MKDCEHDALHDDLAERARQSMPDDESILSLAAAFKAISEPSRLKILFALRQGEMCVYHITRAVGSTQSAVSHQLRILREGHIIRARRDGQNIVYSLADAHVVAVLALACEHLNCAF